MPAEEKGERQAGGVYPSVLRLACALVGLALGWFWLAGWLVCVVVGWQQPSGRKDGGRLWKEE